jgi:hypothetical protein
MSQSSTTSTLIGAFKIIIELSEITGVLFKFEIKNDNSCSLSEIYEI